MYITPILRSLHWLKINILYQLYFASWQHNVQVQIQIQNVMNALNLTYPGHPESSYN